jgi:hypothetical protein
MGFSSAYTDQMREAERQLKLALQSEDMDKIHAALHQISKLQSLQYSNPARPAAIGGLAQTQ